MRTARRIAILIVALVLAFVLAALGLPRFGSGRLAWAIAAWLRDPTFRSVVEGLWFASFAILLAFLVRGVLFPPAAEPKSLRAQGAPDVEVTLDALLSVARAAASEEDVMVERSWGSVRGRAHDEAVVTLELIAFVNEGLDDLGARVQRRVEAACADMLGVSAVRVRVRFLPAKTTMTTKEA